MTSPSQKNVNLLIADSFSRPAIDKLKTLANVQYKPDLKSEELPALIQDYHILVVRSTKVTAQTIENGKSLSLIVRAGAGVNTIDVDAASKQGIFVSNCPGKNSAAVAELTLGFLLALDRRIPENVLELRERKWNKTEFSRADGLLGKTLGIIGLGSIGKEVAFRAKSFGMKISGFSRALTKETARVLEIEFCPDLLSLAAGSDAVSIHLSLNSETKNLIGQSFFQAMKPRAIFINTSRAEIVDTESLLKAVQEKKIRVGLDVFPDEPGTGKGEYSHPILNLPGVYGTHHIGASTEQAQEAIANETVRIINRYLTTGEVENCVNLSQNTPATHQLVIRHKDKVGVLAGILDLLKEAKINIEEMENRIFEGKEAAVCKIRLSSKPQGEILTQIQSSKDIIQVELLPV
jgi:D-3-phosphoglycerate dehydrogenase